MVAGTNCKSPENREQSYPGEFLNDISRNLTDAMNGMPFYFPKPHAPWERGTNENTNGLIREYCPKSVDMENFGEGQIASFIAKLNRRPRKCLGWKSPFEVFFNTLLHLT